MARAKQKSTTRDPVYAEIEKHQKAMKEFYQALKLAPGATGPDPEKEPN